MLLRKWSIADGIGILSQSFHTALCNIWLLGNGYGPEENSWEPFEMLEDTAMQALQQFHERYPSKPNDYRVIDNPNRGTKRRRWRSEDRPREEGSSVTTLR